MISHQTRKSKAESSPKAETKAAALPAVSTRPPAWVNGLPLQPKLTVNQPGDVYEQEADAVAEQVMRMPARAVSQRLQRCACGGAAGPDGECEQCKARRLALQRKGDSMGGGEAPQSVHQTLNRPGQPLDESTRGFMESRFGADFGGVRVHTDSDAAQSARDVSARAYTVGSDVVFGAGQYAPGTEYGKSLLAHELTHVVQQQGIDLMVARANPQAPLATALTMRLGRVPRTGIQFWPTNVVDTQVGPITTQGGLLSSGASHLNVIIGENLTMQTLARQLLPLYRTATPFTPIGAVAPLPLDIITEDELAQGLMVYNQYYLPVSTMGNWRAGLRFPLPIEINEVTGMATLHPLLIRSLATAFDPAWAPLLNQRAASTTTPPVATLQADAATFLANEPDIAARGIHLGARALTNAVAELPFIREVFRQLGAGAFDVALAFMENMVNRQIAILAAQRDGAAILNEIRLAIAASPGVLSADQQAQRDRANTMLALVAGVAPVAPPSSARARPEKTLRVDTVRLAGSTHNPSIELTIANAIFAQCNIRLVHGVNRTATAAQTTGWLGAGNDLASANNCVGPSAEEQALINGATAAFGLTARIRVFYVPTFTGIAARGYSCPPISAPGAAGAVLRDRIIVQNTAATRTLAHEIGHILLNPGAHPAGTTNVMVPTVTAPRAVTFSNTDCATIYANA